MATLGLRTSLAQRIQQHPHETSRAPSSIVRKQLENLNPCIQLSIKHQRLTYLHAQLQQHMQRYIEKNQQMHLLLTQQLNTLGPASTLERGYAIVTNQQKHVLTHAKEAQLQETLSIRLAHGTIQSQVKLIQED